MKIKKIIIELKDWVDLTEAEQLDRVSKQMGIGTYDPYLKRG